MKSMPFGYFAAAGITFMLAAPTLSAQAESPHVSPPSAFDQCQACHVVTRGAKPTIGPNLFGVAGSRAGSRPDYNYSNAMKSSTLVWTPKNLEAFIANPQQVIKGTKMPFFGEHDARKREEIVNFLAALK